MKQFWAIFLTFLFFSIGTISIAFYYMLSGFLWYHVFLLLGSQIISLPALIFWEDYFTNLFFENKKD